jgi:glycosyltransferase involved in cell wall biosynthesis
MRILVISNLFPPAFLGGYEIGASWVCHELRRRGHEILLWTASDVVEGKRDGFRILHQPRNRDYAWLPSGPTFYGVDVLGGLLLGRDNVKFREIDEVLRDYFRTYPAKREERRRMIGEFQPELVLTFNPSCLLDPVFAELAGLESLTGVRSFALVSDDWMLRWRDCHPLVHAWRYLHHLRAGGARPGWAVDGAYGDLAEFLLANGVFAFDAPPDFNDLGFTSDFLRKKSRPAIPPGVPTRIAHWGLPDVAGYPQIDPARFKTDQPLQLAFCGQVQPHKGLIVVLQALALTKRPHRLLVVGDDSSYYGRFCRAFVREAGLENRVEFTGKLPPAEVAPRLAGSAQVLLLPSQVGGSFGFEEPFSIVLLQGMAMGMAVAASRTGGSLEAIVDRETGRFFNPDRPEEIARLIDDLDLHRDATRKMAAAGRRRIESEFTVEKMVDRLLAPTAVEQTGPPAFFYAVRNAAIDPANSGCVRVTRRLGRKLEESAPVVFTTWDQETGELRLLRAGQAEVLSRFNGPSQAAGSMPGELLALTPTLRHLVRGSWLVIPEILPAEQLDLLVAAARRNGQRTAAIFYDSIALLQPEFCNAEIRANHAGYMGRLAQCDVVIPISHFSERCLLELWQAADLAPAPVTTVLLPGEFSGHRPAADERRAANGEIRVLCVSTLEPRKNHQRLLAAFARARELHPEANLQLDLVGNSYAGAMEITAEVLAASERHGWLKWWRIVDDQKLRELYLAADYTVYPSLIEGFGLPILESVWHGRPCLCSNDGVMAELAADGGCLTVDVRDEARLASALALLATDTGLRARLAEEAEQRPLKTWQQYAGEIQQVLQNHSHES